MPQVSFCSKAQRKPFMSIRTFTHILPTSKILLPRLLAAFLPTARRPKAHPMSRRPSRKRLYPIQFQGKIPKRIPPKTQPLNPTRRIIRRLLSKPQPTFDGVHVYITPSGKKYHYSSSCGGANAYQTTLDEALSEGKTPCKKCVK